MRPMTLALLGSLALVACAHPEPPGAVADGPSGGDVDAATSGGADGALADGSGLDGMELDAVPADAGGPVPDARPPLTTTAMIAAACTGTSCDPGKVVAYWRSEWDTYAVKRTIRFVDVSATEHRLEVTDAEGAPATLAFEAGIPVSLTILNPGDTASTGKHGISAPELFRAVAWRRVKTLTGEVRATTFDAVHVRRRSGTDLSAVLEFVPMNPGTFDVYCPVAVPNGDQFEAIVAGTVEPDLAIATGHAGKGAKLSASITTASSVAIAHTPSPLGADPRRAATASVWAAAVRNEVYRASPISLYEFTDEEYAFIPANLSLTAGVGHVLRFENSIEDVRSHAYASAPLFSSSVVRKVQDDDVEVDTSTLTSVYMLVGGFMEAFVVPTVDGTFGAYCDIAVQANPDGSPKLTTGHAGRGMVGSVTVTP